MWSKHIYIIMALSVVYWSSLCSQEITPPLIMTGDAIEVYERIQELNTIGNKSVSNITHQMDSIYYWNDDEDQDFQLSGKNEFVYDRNSVTYLNYEADSSFNFFARNFFVYEFDAEGKLLRFTNNPWDGDRNNLDVINPSSTYEAQYTFEGLLELEMAKNNLDYLLDRPTNLGLYFYDATNKLERVQSYVRYNNSDTLTYVARTNYSYDERQNLSTIVNYRNHDVRGWELRDSILYMYYPDGLLNRVETHAWFGSYWYPAYFTEFYYNADATIDYIRDFESYDDEEENWRVKLTHRYEYASSGDLVEIVTRADGEMYARRVENYEHDFNIIDNDLLKPPILFNEDDKPHIHAVTRDFEWNNPWPGDPSSRYREYFYSERRPSKVEEQFSSSSYNVFPNPATETIDIKSQQPFNQVDLKIYSIAGLEVLTQQVDSKELIDISVLAPGVYICKVTQAGITEAIRFVKL